MQFAVAADGCGHQGENDIVDAGSGLVADGFDFRQRNLSGGEFLWSAVDHVEAEPLGEGGDFRKQAHKLVAGHGIAVGSGALGHGQQVGERGENSFYEIRIGFDEPGGQRG